MLRERLALEEERVALGRDERGGAFGARRGTDREAADVLADRRHLIERGTAPHLHHEPVLVARPGDGAHGVAAGLVARARDELPALERDRAARPLSFGDGGLQVERRVDELHFFLGRELRRNARNVGLGRVCCHEEREKKHVTIPQNDLMQGSAVCQFPCAASPVILHICLNGSPKKAFISI